MESETKKAIAMVDYIPAELRENKEWIIVYYYNDSKGVKKRKRQRVPKLKNVTTRRRYAKRLCAEINSKLEKGWNPEYEMEAPGAFTLLNKVLDDYIIYLEAEVKLNNLRPDTIRSYKSHATILNKWINERHKDFHCINLTRQLLMKFMDSLATEKQHSSRTYNNYLISLNQFTTYLLKREYISKNPLDGIPKKRKGEKIRTIIPENVRGDIQDYLAINNPAYLILCLSLYYLFIRRTELTKIKVKDIKLDDNYVLLRAEVSKNRKREIVTIPKSFKQLLANHILRAKQDDYVFSKADFFPGSEQLKPKKISDEWTKMRSKLGFKKEYQFYSLKDTGITNMLQKGIPAIKVRDQARHSGLNITEEYTPRLKKADKDLLEEDILF